MAGYFADDVVAGDVFHAAEDGAFDATGIGRDPHVPLLRSHDERFPRSQRGKNARIWGDLTRQVAPTDVKHIAAWYHKIKEANPGHVGCVAVLTNNERDEYAAELSRLGCPVHQITGDSVDIDDPTPLRLATMHRIKGLEFDHVCLASCDPARVGSLPVDRQPTERCLLHVAATRTKNTLLVTCR